MANYQNVTPQQLTQAAITASITTVYIVPTSTRTYLKDIDICNTTNAAITVNLYLPPTSVAAGTSNALFYGLSVAANTTYHWVGTQILLTGQSIQVSASTTGCTIIASGGEAV
jgi:hypothetical protein